MSLGVKTKVDIPKIEIETPESLSFWKAVGIELVKDIRKRTQQGLDADNRAFRQYKPSTLKQRVKRGRSSKVNLTDSGQMLGAMAFGVRPDKNKNGVRIKLTGRQGFKAWNIKFGQRRNFFAFNEKQVEKVIKRIKIWMARKNK